MFASLVYFGLACLVSAPEAGGEVPVGIAVVDITPEGPIRMNGYESRKAESEGVETRLKARALALGGDEGEGPAVLLAVENCGVPARVTDEVAARLQSRAKLPRARFVVCSTHTHTGPCLDNGIPFLFGTPPPTEQTDRIRAYTRALTDSLEKVALAALADRKPGRLAWGQGSVGFAANRRVLKDGRWTGFGVNPNGPVDHRLPVLRVTAPDGTLRAVLVNYACHCTTLGGDFNKICGDWAGYASEAIEKDHPGATALVVIGCGADANPEPRTGLDHAQRHGSAVAREVERLLKGALHTLPGGITARFRTIDLPFGTVPTREELSARTGRPGAEGYFARTMVERLDRGESLATTVPYPVQSWTFGDALAIVFLGGEVVVDYALRLSREFDPARLWVVAYSNDMPCYIASKRMLAEGGYEVDSSMIYYGRPTRLAPESEDRIIRAVHELLPKTFEKAAP